jgi:hypothetical protein
MQRLVLAAERQDYLSCLLLQPITLIIVGFTWVFQMSDLLLVYEMMMICLSAHNSLSMRWSYAYRFSIVRSTL